MHIHIFRRRQNLYREIADSRKHPTVFTTKGCWSFGISYQLYYNILCGKRIRFLGPAPHSPFNQKTAVVLYMPRYRCLLFFRVGRTLQVVRRYSFHNAHPHGETMKFGFQKRKRFRVRAVLTELLRVSTVNNIKSPAQLSHHPYLTYDGVHTCNNNGNNMRTAGFGMLGGGGGWKSPRLVPKWAI